MREPRRDKWDENFLAWKRQKTVNVNNEKKKVENKQILSNYNKEIKEERELIKRKDLRDIPEEMSERKNVILWILIILLAAFVIVLLFDVKNINASWIISIILILVASILAWVIMKNNYVH